MNQSIRTLNLPKSILEELEKNGIYTCDSLKPKFKELVDPQIYQPPTPKTAFELYQTEVDFSNCISINIPQLKKLFQNELSPGQIVELCGEPGSGRTQICYHLSLGVTGGAFYIASGKSFAPNRVREIASSYGGDIEQQLARVQVLEIIEPFELQAAVIFLKSWLEKNEIRLLIIDSLAWILRQKSDLERMNFVYSIFPALRKLSFQHKFAIIVTNDLTTFFTSDGSYNVSSFGDSFTHAVNTRILLTRDGERFKAQVLKSVVNEVEEICFCL